MAARLDAADRVVGTRDDQVYVRGRNGGRDGVQDAGGGGPVHCVHAPLHVTPPALLQLVRVARGRRMTQVAVTRPVAAGVTEAHDAQRRPGTEVEPTCAVGRCWQAVVWLLQDPEALQRGDRHQ